MNLQLSRIAELTHALQLPGIDTNASDLAQQAAKQEWDYLTFLEQIFSVRSVHAINASSICLPAWQASQH